MPMLVATAAPAAPLPPDGPVGVYGLGLSEESHGRPANDEQLAKHEKQEADDRAWYLAQAARSQARLAARIEARRAALLTK